MHKFWHCTFCGVLSFQHLTSEEWGTRTGTEQPFCFAARWGNLSLCGLWELCWMYCAAFAVQKTAGQGTWFRLSLSGCMEPVNMNCRSRLHPKADRHRSADCKISAIGWIKSWQFWIIRTTVIQMLEKARCTGWLTLLWDAGKQKILLALIRMLIICGSLLSIFQSRADKIQWCLNSGGYCSLLWICSSQLMCCDIYCFRDCDFNVSDESNMIFPAAFRWIPAWV